MRGVLQEIIYRYRALDRWPDGQQVYTLARSLFPDVLAITGAVMDCANQLADEDPRVSARDAVHAAVVAVYKLEGICLHLRPRLRPHPRLPPGRSLAPASTARGQTMLKVHEVQRGPRNKLALAPPSVAT